MAWYRRLVWFCALFTLFLVGVGAYVRLSEAGLGCPDWPGCFGRLSPAQAVAHIREAEASNPVGNVSMLKAWKEMNHRYLATTLGLMCIVLVAGAWRARHALRQSPWLMTLILVVLIVQGIFGALTVTQGLKPVIVTTHLLGGMTTFVLFVWQGLRQQAFPSVAISVGLRRLAWLALVVVIVQIALGGWVSTNVARPACTDFPTCQGEWVPKALQFDQAFHPAREYGHQLNGAPITQGQLMAIHWTHRVGALVVFLLVAWTALRLRRHVALRGLGRVMGLAVAVQLALGVSVVLWQGSIAVAVAHNMVAAVLLATLVTLNYRLNARGSTL